MVLSNKSSRCSRHKQPAKMPATSTSGEHWLVINIGSSWMSQAPNLHLAMQLLTMISKEIDKKNSYPSPQQRQFSWPLMRKCTCILNIKMNIKMFSSIEWSLRSGPTHSKANQYARLNFNLGFIIHIQLPFFRHKNYTFNFPLKLSNMNGTDNCLYLDLGSKTVYALLYKKSLICNNPT